MQLGIPLLAVGVKHVIIGNTSLPHYSAPTAGSHGALLEVNRRFYTDTRLYKYTHLYVHTSTCARTYTHKNRYKNVFFSLHPWNHLQLSASLQMGSQETLLHRKARTRSSRLSAANIVPTALLLGHVFRFSNSFRLGFFFFCLCFSLFAESVWQRFTSVETPSRFLLVILNYHLNWSTKECQSL